MKPQQWNAGDAIAASRLNSLTRESLRSRNGEALGPGNCEVGDNFGSSSANHSKPAMHLCFATEDFKADQYTDNYLALDKIASGKCVLVRFNPSTGDYEEEKWSNDGGYGYGGDSGFEPFRVWDPMAKINDTPNKALGDVFHAMYNKDNCRLEIVSASVALKEGLMSNCLGDGWYKIEEAIFPESVPEYPQDDCDLCSVAVPEYDADCGTIVEYTANKTRPEGTGKYIKAHDARTLKIRGGGHVRVLPIHRDPSTGEQLYAIVSAEYEMLRVPVTDWECCNGEVIQTRCDFLIIEGTYCPVWTDECYP
jgi:hypothetical protein